MRTFISHISEESKTALKLKNFIERDCYSAVNKKEKKN